MSAVAQVPVVDGVPSSFNRFPKISGSSWGEAKQVFRHAVNHPDKMSDRSGVIGWKTMGRTGFHEWKSDVQELDYLAWDEISHGSRVSA